MKKLLSILLTVCMCFASCVTLISCNGETETDETTAATTEATAENTTEAITEATTDDEPIVSGGITKDEWDGMIQTANFDNVTFAYEATFVGGTEVGNPGPHGATFKFLGDRLVMDGEVDDDPETIEAFKTWYVGSALAITNNFDLFVYDSETDCYNATENVVYSLSILGYDATITAANASVQLDKDTNIAKIVCKMTQEFEEGGQQKVFILDVVFQFSDYGTTVA